MTASLLKRLRNGRFASCVEVLELTLHSDVYLVMGVRDSKGTHPALTMEGNANIQ